MDRGMPIHITDWIDTGYAYVLYVLTVACAVLYGPDLLLITQAGT